MSSLRSGLLAAASSLLLVACGDPGAKPLSGLLVTLDTTRADALSCYGNARSTTPHLDRLAAEGILFESAHTTVPITLPAHASMLTGLYPPRTGLRENGVASLSPEARTLAELARDEGFQTAAFVGAVVLSAHFGLDQGFQTFSSPERTRVGESPGLHGAERVAAEVVDAALEWLARRDRERPFFLWVHVYDPHHPYAPPAGFDASPWPSPYLAEVAYTDRELGRLFDALRADGTLEETAVLVTSDHGEAFGEHGEWNHGGLCFEPTLKVPLLLRLPDGRRSGDRSSFEASVADVLPTLATAMDLPIPPQIDGVDLLGDSPSREGLYFESFSGYLSYGWSPLSGWLSRGGKYLHSSVPLYVDLARDAAEEHDLSADRREEIRAARTAIARVVAAPALEPLDATSHAGEEVLNSIRALGYAGVAASASDFPDPLAPSDLPAPHVAASYFEHEKRAEELEAEGRLEEALAQYRAVLDEHPGNAYATEESGRLLFLLGRRDEAIATLQELVRTARPQARQFFGLGVALATAKRGNEAVAPLEQAVLLSRGRPHYVQYLVDVLRSLGREQEARVWSESYASSRAE